MNAGCRGYDRKLVEQRYREMGMQVVDGGAEEMNAEFGAIPGKTDLLAAALSIPAILEAAVW